MRADDLVRVGSGQARPEPGWYTTVDAFDLAGYTIPIHTVWVRATRYARQLWVASSEVPHAPGSGGRWNWSPAGIRALHQMRVVPAAHPLWLPMALAAAGWPWAHQGWVLSAYRTDTDQDPATDPTTVVACIARGEDRPHIWRATDVVTIAPIWRPTQETPTDG